MSGKKILWLTFVLALVAVSALAANQWIKVDGTMAARTPQVAVATNTTQDFSFKVHIPSFKVRDIDTDSEIWQQIEFETAGEYSFPGQPLVPVFTRMIAIPQGATPRVKVTGANARIINGVYPYPAQAPAPDCGGDEDLPPFEVDATVYSDDSPFPGHLFEIDGPFVIRGMQMMFLRLYPVQVNPVTKQATVFSDLDVSIEFSGSKGKFFDRHRARSFQKLYDLADNRMAFRDEPMPTLTGKSPNGAEYIILTDPSFVEAAQTLADWKILQGYDTEVYTTDDSGTSVADVKAWIQDAYDTWDPAPEFILFLGDAEFISPTYEVSGYSGMIGSDMGYITVDGDDEWVDIYSGRISVDTLAEANHHIADIINYEREPIYDDDYYTNAYAAAYFQHQGGGVAQRRFCRTSEEMYQWFNNAMPDSPFAVHRIYVTESSVSPMYWNQDTYNWTPDWWWGLGYDDYNIPPDLLRSNGFAWDGDSTDIANAVNGGTCFITHRDHGEETGWADPAFSLAQSEALVNGDMLPVLWSINCLTGYFDNETSSAYHSKCFTEGWERNPNGGAVGILGSTRISYSGRNDRMFWGWLDSMFPDYEPNWPTTKANEPEWRQSILMEYGKIYMSYYYDGDPYRMEAIAEFHWFGDPTLEMWAGIPGELTVDHMPLIPMGTTNFEVEVDVDGALVAAVQDGVILGKAYSSGGSANILFDGPINSIEDVHITITRHQYRPYETEVMVGATSDGVVSLNRSVYTENDTIGVAVSDADLAGEGTYVLHIDSETETAGEDITCTEYEDTGTFFGEIDVTTAAPSEANGVLSIADGDTITLHYTDANTGSGGPVAKTDTAYADTAAPTFAGASSASGGDHKVTLLWSAATDLTPPIKYQIYRAETSGAQNFDVPIAETDGTTYVDNNLPNMVAYFYVVRATDSLGHQDTNTVEVWDFTVGPVLIWEEDFDDKAGIPETWEIVDGGEQGTAYRWSDENPGGRSNANWSGIFVIADSDETGSGHEWNDSLITESIDCTGYSDVRLLFTHDFNWISGYGDDHAIVDVSIDGGETWNNVVDWAADRSGAEDLDISAFADNQSDVKLRFTYTGNYDYWWGIDNLELIGLVDDAPPVLADVMATVTDGVAPLETHFSYSASGYITVYNWDFGDGEVSHEASPTHTYAEIGTYNVSLEVIGPNGDDSMTKNNMITVSCPDPTVDFEADVTTGSAPLEVNFSDLSDTYESCEPTSIEWDFGDGETSTDAEPTHVYDAPGVYTVALTYTTAAGDAEFTETKVSYITVECDAPAADFEADVTEGPAPLTVQFTDLSVAAEACAISSWTWAYGTSLDDMTTMTEQNPQVTFEEPGVYHVALRVTNAAGDDQEVKMEMITVTEASVDDDTTDDDTDDDDDDDDDDLTDDDDDLTDDDQSGDDDDDDDDDDGCGC